jgi:hypothetical protein
MAQPITEAIDAGTESHGANGTPRSSHPHSCKVYVTGKTPGVRVPMR